jgi:hypothetical protein
MAVPLFLNPGFVVLAAGFPPLGSLSAYDLRRLDVTGRLSESFDTATPYAILVRPDFHVAAATKDPESLTVALRRATGWM